MMPAFGRKDIMYKYVYALAPGGAREVITVEGYERAMEYNLYEKPLKYFNNYKAAIEYMKKDCCCIIATDSRGCFEIRTGNWKLEGMMSGFKTLEEAFDFIEELFKERDVLFSLPCSYF